MSTVDRVYSDTCSYLMSMLLDFGFYVQKDEKTGPFGSRYIELHREKEAIRFLWDGREGWFLLGYCDDISMKPYPKWEDLYFEKLDIRKADNEKYEEVEGSLRIAIDDLKDKLEGV